MTPSPVQLPGWKVCTSSLTYLDSQQFLWNVPSLLHDGKLSLHSSLCPKHLKPKLIDTFWGGVDINCEYFKHTLEKKVVINMYEGCWGLFLFVLGCSLVLTESHNPGVNSHRVYRKNLIAVGYIALFGSCIILLLPHFFIIIAYMFLCSSAGQMNCCELFSFSNQWPKNKLSLQNLPSSSRWCFMRMKMF